MSEFTIYVSEIQIKMLLTNFLSFVKKLLCIREVPKQFEQEFWKRVVSAYLKWDLLLDSYRIIKLYLSVTLLQLSRRTS